MTEITRGEFNGLGGRVGRVETCIAEEKVKTKRNEQDIQKVFDGLEVLAETGTQTYKQIRDENAKNSRDLLIRMVFIFSVGIGLMILKDVFIKG